MPPPSCTTRPVPPASRATSCLLPVVPRYRISNLTCSTPAKPGYRQRQRRRRPGGALGSAAYFHDFQSDRWVPASTFWATAGAGLDYDDNWAGRCQATKVDLLLAALVPTLAYKVSDRLSLGIAVQYWYSDLNTHLDTPRINQDGEDLRGLDQR